MVQEVVGVIPLHYSAWALALQGHPDVHYICMGLRFGFRISSIIAAQYEVPLQNMSAIQHHEPIRDYVEKELQLGRMLVPFPVRGMLQSAIYRSDLGFGVIPKGHNNIMYICSIRRCLGPARSQFRCRKHCQPPAGPVGGLDLSNPDAAVRHYFHQGLASSTHRSYDSPLRSLNTFCTIDTTRLHFSQRQKNYSVTLLQH